MELKANLMMQGSMAIERLSGARIGDAARDIESLKKLAKATGSDSSLSESESKELKQACQNFEAVFLGYLMKEMRKTVHSSAFLPEMPGHKIYESMFDDEIAKAASAAGGTGVADLIYEQLSHGMKEETTGKDLGTQEESAKDIGLNSRYKLR